MGSSPTAELKWTLSHPAASAVAGSTTGCPLADITTTQLTLSSKLGEEAVPPEDDLSTDDMFVALLIVVALGCFLARGGCSRKLDSSHEHRRAERSGYGVGRFAAGGPSSTSDSDDDDERQRMLPSGSGRSTGAFPYNP